MNQRDDAPLGGSVLRVPDRRGHTADELLACQRYHLNADYVLVPLNVRDRAVVALSETTPRVDLLTEQQERVRVLQHDMGVVLQTACDADEADPRELLSKIASIAVKH